MRHSVFLALLVLLAVNASADTTISYQGQLQGNGQPFNGQIDMTFELFDDFDPNDPSVGSSVAGPIAVNDVEVSNGMFQVDLDFGAVYEQPAWIEITVGTDTLHPRQRLTSTPVAVNALNVTSTTGAWMLGGNAGTDPVKDFFGTTDTSPLELRVNDRAVTRIIDGTDVYGNHAPHLIAGSELNVLDESDGAIAGTTIAGGGGRPDDTSCGLDRSSPCINLVSANFATIVGGWGNYATSSFATAMGLRATASSSAATALGSGTTASGPGATAMGSGTTASNTNATAMGFGTTASGYASTAVGSATTASNDNATAMGRKSTASGSASTAMGYMTTASGQSSSTAMGHETTASGLGATAMGRQTAAGGDFSLAAGRRATVRDATATGETGADGNCDQSFGNCGDEGTFVWADTSTVGHFTSTGQDQFLIRARGGMGVNENAPETALHIVSSSPDIDAQAQIHVEGEETSGAEGTGAAVAFLGHDGNIRRRWGRIVNVKENSTVGNTRARMSFHVRGASGLPQERVRIESDGTTVNSTGTWATFSDRRMKKDIESIEQPLDRLLSLEGIVFEYIDNPEEPILKSGELRMGFVAQEVEEVFPEWVRESASGFKQVSMVGFEALAVEAIRKLSLQQEQMQSKIAARDSRIQELESRLMAAETERHELREDLDQYGSLAERNANLERRLLALEELLSEREAVAGIQE